MENGGNSSQVTRTRERNKKRRVILFLEVHHRSEWSAFSRHVCIRALCAATEVVASAFQGREPSLLVRRFVSRAQLTLFVFLRERERER